MSTFSTNPALEAAIVAHAEEDTPRLVYADWLDEHGNPDRAAFIRGQCAFAATTFASPNYPEAEHDYYTGRSRAWWWVRSHPVALPTGFHAREAHHSLDSDAYQRGFLYKAKGDWTHDPPEDAEVDRVCSNLAELVGTTTVRFLELPDVTADQLTRILAAPGAEKLTGLSVGPSWSSGDDMARALAGAKSVRGLKQLILNGAASGTGIRALARAPFERLTLLDLPALECPAAAVNALTATRWFRKLKVVWALRVGRTAQSALLHGLARLPALDRLVIRLDHTEGLNAFAARDGFPTLGDLSVYGESVLGAVGPIARGRFPMLRSLDFNDLRNADFRQLLAAPWFRQLLILEVNPGKLTDSAIRALAKSSAAANLQYLRLGDNRIGPTGFNLLADANNFPAITLLDLDAKQRLRIDAAQTRDFAQRLKLPHLRTLYLDAWPLGNAGAAALASNPTLANVDGLSVSGCGLTDRGFNAMVRSPYLNRVVNFTAENNEFRSLAALLEPGTMTDVRHLWVPNTRVSRRTADRLRPTRNWVVEIGDE